MLQTTEPLRPGLRFYFLNSWSFTGLIFSAEVVELALERLKAPDGQAVLLSEYNLQLNCWGKSGPDGAAA